MRPNHPEADYWTGPYSSIEHQFQDKEKERVLDYIEKGF
jgi:hypothetical protein